MNIASGSSLECSGVLTHLLHVTFDDIPVGVKNKYFDGKG
jgi:hypothetical protein